MAKHSRGQDLSAALSYSAASQVFRKTLLFRFPRSSREEGAAGVASRERLWVKLRLPQQISLPFRRPAPSPRCAGSLSQAHSLGY